MIFEAVRGRPELLWVDESSVGDVIVTDHGRGTSSKQVVYSRAWSIMYTRDEDELYGDDDTGIRFKIGSSISSAYTGNFSSPYDVNEYVRLTDGSLFGVPGTPPISFAGQIVFEAMWRRWLGVFGLLPVSIAVAQSKHSTRRFSL